MQLGMVMATAHRVAEGEKFDPEPIVDLIQRLTADDSAAPEKVLTEGTWAEKWEQAESESEDEEEPSIPGVT